MQDISSKTAVRRYQHSSSFKMAALFTLLLGMSALLLGYTLYDFGRQNFVRETEAAIDSEIEHMLTVASLRGPQGIVEYIRDRTAGGSHPVYFFQDNAGRKLAGNMDALPQQAERITEGVISFQNTVREGGDIELAAKIHTFEDGSRLLIARNIDAIMQSYSQLQWISGIIMLFMLAVVLVSFFISRFVVRRINLIADTAQHIMDTGDLSQRISVDSRWDDLSNLAVVLNRLFARVEELMQGIRDVTDNIAHDLRTPLSRLRTHIEAARKHNADSAVLDALQAEVDQLLNMFNALLRIVNIEKGKRHQEFTEVQLSDVLQDVAELYEPLAEEKQITLQVNIAPAIVIPGDRDLLFQLFANLLDNAVKFAPEKGEVGLSVHAKRGGGVWVEITDNGPGIADADREQVFQRFYRGEKSRHTQGSGLGLSLVKAVLAYHKGTITLLDNAPGLRVQVAL